MKSPDELNIDEWLFHYFEGDLNPEDEAMLEEYLLDNPQYDAQLEAWGAARIQREEVIFPDQHKILKPLITLGFLHKAAVFTAIAINAILASFIIFGDRTSKGEYDFVAIQQASYSVAESNFASNDSYNRVPNVSGSSKNIVTNRTGRSFSTTLSTFAYQSFAKSNYLRAQNQLASSNVAYNSMAAEPSVVASKTQNRNRNISLFNLSNSDIGLLASTVLENREEDTHGSSVDFSAGDSGSEANPLANGQQIAESKTSSENSNTNKQADKQQVDKRNSSGSAAKTSEGKDSKSPELSHKDNKQSSGKDVKESRNSSGFRRGSTSLTNTRTQEYLVPGANRNQINFAHVGSDMSNTVYSNTFLQWPGKGNQMFVNQLGYDLFLPQIKSGLGLQVMYGSYGPGAIRDVETALTFSPKIVLSKNFILEPAVRLRMSTTGVNRSQLTPGSWIEFDRGNTFQYTAQQHDLFVNRSIQQDLGVGLMLNSRWGYAGVNADNLVGNINEAVYYGNGQNLQRAPIYFNAVLGTEYQSFNKRTLWSGQLVYQKHGDLSKLWVGTRIKLNYISLGASVSNIGEPMFSAGLVTKGLSIFYTGDYSYNRLYNDKFLSHQLLMRFTLKESRMKKLLLN